MHRITFATGGFVLHRVHAPEITRCRVSAWYDAAGRLLDATRTDSRGRSYWIEPAGRGPLPVHLRRIGPLWRPTTAAVEAARAGLTNVGPRRDPGMIGRDAYEADREREPLYSDGTPRPPFDRLDPDARASWNRRPRA